MKNSFVPLTARLGFGKIFSRKKSAKLKVAKLFIDNNTFC
jgi:hypothetical protein